MRTSSLESKTIRPGLNSYSFYHSDRHLSRQAPQAIPVKRKSESRSKLIVVMILILVSFASYTLLHKNYTNQHTSATAGSSSSPSASAIAPLNKSSAATASANKCAGNSIPQYLVISVTDRHLWVCEASKLIRNYPVITGMQKIEENATPPGTYKIYAKQRDTVLSGVASTGSWRDPVSYWMPFLDNNFGTYGFHDASWRKNSEFGKIDPYSDKGSHGCIEMNTADSEWLYNWAHVGATVTITL